MMDWFKVTTDSTSQEIHEQIVQWDWQLIEQGISGQVVMSALSNDHLRVTYFLSKEFAPMLQGQGFELCKRPLKSTEKSLKLIIGDPMTFHSSE